MTEDRKYDLPEDSIGGRVQRYEAMKARAEAAERDLADLTLAFTDALGERDEARACAELMRGWAGCFCGFGVPEAARGENGHEQGCGFPDALYRYEAMLTALAATPEGKAEG